MTIHTVFLIILFTCIYKSQTFLIVNKNAKYHNKLNLEINYVNKDILHTQNKYVIIPKNIYKEK